MAKTKTVRIDEGLHEAVKVKAAKAGLKLGRLTEILLDEWLKGRFFCAGTSTAEPFTTTQSSSPVRSPLTPASPACLHLHPLPRRGRLPFRR